MKKILKSLFNALPFKKHLFGLIKAGWSLPSSIYRHLHFKGPFTVEVNDKVRFKMQHYGFELENEIFWSGLRGWEEYSLDIWIKLCEYPGTEVILDIGANTGVYALIAKSLNPKARVIAMEPVQRVFQKLKYNAQINNMDIVCIEEAASNFDGEAIIYDMPTAHIYSVTVNENFLPKDEKFIETKIRTKKISTVLNELKISQANILKIDVETHEAEVLEGMESYLFSNRPSMLIEILNDKVASKIQNIIEGMGYLYFNIDERRGIRRTEQLEKSDYYNFLICNEEVAKYLNLI